jgi:hypothetical protein
MKKLILLLLIWPLVTGFDVPSGAYYDLKATGPGGLAVDDINMNGFSLCLDDVSEFCYLLNTDLQLQSDGNVIASYGLGANGDITFDARGTGLFNLQDFVCIDSSGVCTPSTIATADNNLYVKGNMEIDGAVYIDGVTTMVNRLNVSGSAIYSANGIWIGSNILSDYGGLRAVPDDGLHLVAGNTTAKGNHNVILASSDYYFSDYDHDTLSPDPTFFFQSGENPDTDNTQWGSITHDQTDMIISTGKGHIFLNSTVKTAPYTRHIDIAAGAAALGPSAPSVVTLGTLRCLEFDNDNEEGFLEFEVPDDWVGTTSSDMKFKIYWTAESGDVIADGETVKYDIVYRSLDFDANEPYDNGATTSMSATYTQVGAGTDKSTHELEITLDADDASNPLVKGEVVGFNFTRDVSGDTYSGAGNVCRWEIEFSSNGLPEH